VDSLIDFRHQAPGMPYAHPTIEHFSPLFVALGACSDPGQTPRQVIDGYWMGLAKRSIELD
jgi:4,5-DOPA dioxygenase extradiol